MYKLVFYVPESYLASVKQAIFKAGAGKAGHYEQCCWEIEGMGQFLPGVGSQPFIGEQTQLTQVKEFRVETICSEEAIVDALEQLREAHPYEEPAIDVWPLSSF